MTLTRVGHAPGSANETAWHNALANAFAAVSGRVCSVCGLDGVGHAPATAWLGYDKHPFDGIPADEVMLTAAAELSREATANRLANGSHSVCGHRYANAQCKTQCAHVGGHCGNCD